MHAVFASLAVVLLTCKMAAADGSVVFCYQCTAKSAAECISDRFRHLGTILCSRSGYEIMKLQEEMDADRKLHNEKKDNTFYDKIDADLKKMRENSDADFNEGKRFIIEIHLLRQMRSYLEVRKIRLGQVTRDEDDVLRGLKLIEIDKTIPMEVQSDRAMDWIEQIGNFVKTEEKIDQASIEVFNKRFSDKWKTTYEARVKEEEFVVNWGKHQYLISNDSTADKWCATFDSKQFGFHRGCGVIIEDFVFEPGCHNMSGAHEGITYCRCDKEECNGQASNDDDDESNEGVKLIGKIVIILVATLLANLL